MCRRHVTDCLILPTTGEINAINHPAVIRHRELLSPLGSRRPRFRGFIRQHRLRIPRGWNDVPRGARRHRFVFQPELQRLETST
jgi:hypothetical protein